MKRDIAGCASQREVVGIDEAAIDQSNVALTIGCVEVESIHAFQTG